MKKKKNNNHWVSLPRLASSGPVLIASYLSLALAEGECRLNVEDTVYCDTCRTQFLTHVSKTMPDAKVLLECRNRKEGNKVTSTVEGETNRSGRYSLAVQGERGNELYETVLVKSSKPDCQEINGDAFP